MVSPRLHHLKTYGTGFRPHGPRAVAGGLFCVLWHQFLQVGLGGLLLLVGRAGAPVGGGELRPGVGGTDGLRPRFGRLERPPSPCIALLATIPLLQAMSAASAERIKRPPPDDTELARLASDQVMNDDLRKGDIISTDRPRLPAVSRIESGRQLRFCSDRQSPVGGKACAGQFPMTPRVSERNWFQN